VCAEAARIDAEDAVADRDCTDRCANCRDLARELSTKDLLLRSQQGLIVTHTTAQPPLVRFRAFLADCKSSPAAMSAPARCCSRTLLGARGVLERD
jgi:hypothetical protein